MVAWIVAAVAVAGAVATLAVAAHRERRAQDRETALRARAVGAETEHRLTREFETQLAQALEAMDLGVVVIDANGTAAFRNRAADAFVSARHGNALVEAALTELLESARRGVIGEREVELIGPPLSSFLIRAFPLLTGDETERNGAVALVEESTERRRLDQVRRDFVANISHELRTPIGAIGLLAETIHEEPERDVVDRLSQRMVSEAERVTATIEDLMELSRIEFGDGMAVGAVSVREIVEDAVARIAAAAEQRGISVDTRMTGTPTVHGDRRQLVSAVFNLIDNAVKFSREGSDVIVEVTVIRDSVQLSVIDHGIGIPERDVGRVFERFYRVDRARSRETGGTGLGLAIVRHVVSNHGGEIRVSSREGEGSTFSLALPLVMPAPIVAPPHPASSPTAPRDEDVEVTSP